MSHTTIRHPKQGINSKDSIEETDENKEHEDNYTYVELYSMCKTDIEKALLETLKENNYRLPDKYGITKKDIKCDYGFYYEDLMVFVLCIDADMNEIELLNIDKETKKLKSKGIQIVEIIFSKPLIQQINEDIEIFIGR
jgi:hypothetical protein